MKLIKRNCGSIEFNFFLLKVDLEPASENWASQKLECAIFKENANATSNLAQNKISAQNLAHPKLNLAHATF